MIRVLGTLFAGLLGLAFGSFLNVCLSRWPEGDSIVHPRSHCRSCGRTLAWWENVPLVSWLVLRGRCRTCGAEISWRYPVVELAVGVLWAVAASRALILIQWLPLLNYVPVRLLESDALHFCGRFVFTWLLTALLVLDAEHQWLPDKLTLPGIVLGFIYRFGDFILDHSFSFLKPASTPLMMTTLGVEALSILGAAALILLIRWIYWLVRRREGIGLGDAKLMAMLAAWLGLEGALLSFAVGVVLGALAALVLLVLPSTRKNSEGWALTKLPLGTFLCVGGIVSCLWGEPIIRAYLRWAGF